MTAATLILSIVFIFTLVVTAVKIIKIEDSIYDLKNIYKDIIKDEIKDTNDCLKAWKRTADQLEEMINVNENLLKTLNRENKNGR